MAGRSFCPMAGRMIAAAAIVLAVGVGAQHSKPVPDNSHIARNKFKQRDVSGVEDIVFGTDASRFDPLTACPQRIHQNWATEIEASCYVTPAIFDVASDGVKDVVIPTFIRHIEVVDGAHGQHVAGFPFTFPNSAFYSSPIIFDINVDGEPDIGITSFNGELVWLSETGMPIFGKSIKIPHLRVKKDWYKGLKDDPQDLQHTGLTEHEREELERKPDLPDDPFASGKLPSQNKENYWDNRDAGWGDYGPHKMAEDKFSAGDTDKDKQLSLDEFVNQVTHEDPMYSRTEAEHLFSDIDEDHDKQITIRELTLHMDEFESNRADSEFYNHDMNGDAKVDVDEFVTSFRDAKNDLSEEKVRARFKDVDSNKDEGIDLAEAKEHWDYFMPDGAEQSKVKRKKKGINRYKVAERAKDQLQAVFRIESDKAELGSILAGNELKDAADTLKGLGIENVADLGHLTETEISNMGLKPVQVGKLKELAAKYRLKTGTSSRRLLSAEGASAASERAPSHTQMGVENRAKARRDAARDVRARREVGEGGRKLLQTDPAVGDEGSAGAGAERRCLCMYVCMYMNLCI
jgi:Ca2+-binding EF-hand superfamily protein